MAILYEVTQTNATGFVTIPGDDRNDIIDLDLKEKYVFSAYEGFAFSVDINFRAYYIQPMTTTKVYVDILRIDVLYDFPSIALTATKIDVDTIRLSGATNNIFPNTFYSNPQHNEALNKFNNNPDRKYTYEYSSNRDYAYKKSQKITEVIMWIVFFLTLPLIWFTRDFSIRIVNFSISLVS